MALPVARAVALLFLACLGTTGAWQTRGAARSSRLATPWGKAVELLQQAPLEEDADAALRNADRALDNADTEQERSERRIQRSGGEAVEPGAPRVTPDQRSSEPEAAPPRPAERSRQTRTQRNASKDTAEKETAKAEPEHESAESEVEEIFEEVVEEVQKDKPLTQEEAEKEVKSQLGEFIKASGLKKNKGGDLWKMIATVRASLILISACIIAFHFLRNNFPQVYANNVQSLEDGGYGTAPFEPKATFFGWIEDVFTVEYEEAEVTSGTDGALNLVFIEFVLRTTAWIGAPALLILAPLHLYAGGGVGISKRNEEPDYVSSIGLNNVPKGHWVVWVQVAFVWYVVVMVLAQTFREMGRFMPRRFRWLKRLRPPRSTTILVENIPDRCCSDEALKEFFQSLFPGEDEVCEKAYMIKRIDKLEVIMSKYEDIEKKLHHVRHEMDEEGVTDELQAEERKHLEELDVIAQEATDEQIRVKEAATLPMVDGVDILHGHPVKHLQPEARDVLASAGFVTFKSERITLMVLNLHCYEDSDKFIMSIPPPPSDIIYDDLKVDPSKQVVCDIIGYFLIGFLFYCFIPAIIFFAVVIRIIVEHFPIIEAVGLEGVMATLPLQIFLSFLPTLLFAVFTSCFALKAEVWGQKLLQTTFFIFNVLFTLLVTAVIGAMANYPGGQYEAAIAMARYPDRIPGMLADALPDFTHYYMDFMLVRWATHCMELTRYVTFMKFLLFRKMYGEEMAIEMAEPEDQDFYGIGARCTRFALDFLVGLIFCTMSPVITVIVFINAIISRICFGYLVVFAEIKKHDIGGVFFVSMLHHVQIGLFLYVSLMMGVVWRWSGEHGRYPWLITSLAMLYLLVAYYRFNKKFSWQVLPFDEVCDPDNLIEAKLQMKDYLAIPEEHRPAYRQPELFLDFKGHHHKGHSHGIRHDASRDLEDEAVLARESSEESSDSKRSQRRRTTMLRSKSRAADM